MAHQFTSTQLNTASRGGSFWKLLIGMDALWRSRQTLRSLDASALSDIGLSREEAHKESARAPWDVPAHWTKLG